MEVNRVTVGKDKLVYVILQDKKMQYPEGRSRVVYIGTTKNGGARIATSAPTMRRTSWPVAGCGPWRFASSPVSPAGTSRRGRSSSAPCSCASASSMGSRHFRTFRARGSGRGMNSTTSPERG